MEHLSTLFYRLLMHSSICILEEFNFFVYNITYDDTITSQNLYIHAMGPGDEIG